MTISKGHGLDLGANVTAEAQGRAPTVTPRRAPAFGMVACALALLAGCSGGPGGSVVESTSDALSSSLPDLQSAGGWSTCSTSGTNCGGAGGKGTPVMSTFDVATYAGRSKAAEIWVGGSVSYGTAYWYKKMTAPAYQAATVDYLTDFYIPTGTKNQALEWDTQQVHNHTIYNFAWQADAANGQWRIYNYAAHRWEDSGIPYTALAQGVWHSFHAHYRTSGSDVYAESFVLDGVTYTATKNTKHVGVYKATYHDDISIGLQLDQDKAGDTYAVYYDHVQLQYTDGTGGGGGSSGSAGTGGSGGSGGSGGAGGSGGTAGSGGAGGSGGGGGSGGTGTCTAPTIVEPTSGQPVGPAIHLRTSAPSCLTATKCYLDGDPTPVATAATGDITAWVSVGMGAHAVQCNGWDGSGAALRSATVDFTRTY